MSSECYCSIYIMLNKVWGSTTAVELIGKFLVELKEMAETTYKKHIVFKVPVSFTRLNLTRIHRACAAMVSVHVLKVIH